MAVHNATTHQEFAAGVSQLKSFAQARDTVTVTVELQRLLQKDAPPTRNGRLVWSRVQRIYAASGNHALWLETAGGKFRLNRRAAALLEAVSAAAEHALPFRKYVSAELLAALGGLNAVPTGSAVAIARADMLLTSAYAAYGSDLLTGQIDPRTVNRSWYIDPQNVDVDNVLSSALGEQDFAGVLSTFKPQDPDYQMLMRQLAIYRALVASGGWLRMPFTGVIHPGDTTTARIIDALCARLRSDSDANPVTSLAEVCLASGSESQRNPRVYDFTIAGAVAEYQELHG
ncbi:MAG: hypothetical protein ABI852_17370, partial [Gemmatimonadaceae bacterium]